MKTRNEHWLGKQVVILSLIFLVVSVGGMGLITLVSGRPAGLQEGLLAELAGLFSILAYSYFAYVR